MGEERPFRGVFAIPPTPFTDDDSIDEESLRRCVRFCLAAGVQGLVGPVNASESIELTDAERFRFAEIVVEETAGRVPVIIGVSGTSNAAAAQFAHHAASIGADAVIAMPPYIKRGDPDEIVGFYAHVSSAAGVLPMWIQDYVEPIGTPMPPVLIVRVLREVPNACYLKEETAYAPRMMSAVRQLAGHSLKGMMGGMGGRHMIEEHRRGSIGTMPACEVAEVHVRIWQALERGDEPAARRMHHALLPLLIYEAMYPDAVHKEVLRRRGVIRSARTRAPDAGRLDAENHRELDRLLGELAPLLSTHPGLAEAPADWVG